MADFGDFRFSYDLKVIRKTDFLKSDFLIDLKSDILRKSVFLIDSIFFSIWNSEPISL